MTEDDYRTITGAYVHVIGVESYPEIMVLFERLITATMLVLVDIHKFSPSQASLLMDLAHERALEHLTEFQKDKAK